MRAPNLVGERATQEVFVAHLVALARFGAECLSEDRPDSPGSRHQLCTEVKRSRFYRRFAYKIHRGTHGDYSLVVKGHDAHVTGSSVGNGAEFAHGPDASFPACRCIIFLDGGYRGISDSRSCLSLAGIRITRTINHLGCRCLNRCARNPPNAMPAPRLRRIRMSRCVAIGSGGLVVG